MLAVLIDARRVDEGSVLEADVCIVGAGAAGITIARELASTSRSVLVLESGGFEQDKETERLAEGDIVGHRYRELRHTRIRAFGGTTLHWGGICRPLDPVDFEARPGIPDSGWPISRADLDPFYARAHEVLELGPFEYDAAWWNDHDAVGELLPFPSDSPVQTAIWQWSPPTSMGIVYRDELVAAPRVTVGLYANVVNVLTTTDATRVTALDVATLTGRRFQARAQTIVLAAGALENARLLLSSTDVRPDGLGNDHGLVGRFYTDHPHVTAGPALVLRPVDELGMYGVHQVAVARDALSSPRTQLLWASLALTDAARRERGLLGLNATLHPPTPLPFDGFGTLEHLAADVVPLASDVRAPTGATISTLFLRCEQSPNRESRLRLGDERDALGLRRTQLDWRLSELDRQRASRALALLASEMGRLGLGIVRVDAPEDELFGPAVGGPHQVGTLRMSAHPRRGVVDADCRVHGMENLFVAGGAVFPTGGYANPTLTLVALALRLADHVRQDLV